MPRNTELTETERGKILGLRMGNKNGIEIAKILKLPKSTVYDSIKRYEDSENLKSKTRGGRPKILNQENRKKLKEIALRNNHSTLKQIQQKLVKTTDLKISTFTIRRNLHEMGVFSRLAAVNSHF